MLFGVLSLAKCGLKIIDEEDQVMLSTNHDGAVVLWASINIDRHVSMRPM